ncbi:hypothetical protein Kfla_3092 [Kribbella flavida DSM 17836]|uniref:Transmembrane protein n=1 Tax=Kribbella flavida (strain DSM 17836 / JCM 10339 / NBRC 14399) TaxID=479435 RepID=D2Q331_KRIFD|nr:hypothetical protein [Kribbella flavida]ADB32156.1 hypothetical protein Kfla_3092 [Kribbella flavida DSM 17836]
MQGGTIRLARLMPWAWPVLLTVLITAPLLAPGYVVGYDLVFVPDLTLRRDLFGVTTALPRAVPSDVVVALLDEVTGGQVLNKLVLVAVPLLAGFGMTALWRELRLGGPLAGAAAVALYVWNPFVAERLRLGAWALLLGYAALPWLVRSALRLRRGEGWTGFLLASALCALTASGGIVGLGLAALILLWPRGARPTPLIGAALLNLPWIVAGLARSAAATTDPASVPAFAARDEGYGGVVPTLLTLGGVWNANVVPSGRGDLVPLVLAFLMLLVSCIGVSLWCRRERLAMALVVAAGLSLLVAVAGVVAEDPFAWTVAHVPGAGLFRDGQRYLGPLALLEAIGFGTAVAALLRVAPLTWLVGATAALVPIAALPQLVGGGFRLSQYPADWEQANAVLTADARPGELMPWPFESYRAPSWNTRRPVLDPMPRYFSKPAVVPDELIVDGDRLAGEDPRAAAVADALRASVRTGADPSPELLRQGVGWIVVDREAGGPPPRQLIQGLTEVFSGPTVAVHRLDGTPAEQRVPAWRTILVAAAWLAAAGVLAVAAAGVLPALRRVRSKL